MSAAPTCDTEKKKKYRNGATLKLRLAYGRRSNNLHQQKARKKLNIRPLILPALKIDTAVNQVCTAIHPPPIPEKRFKKPNQRGLGLCCIKILYPITIYFNMDLKHRETDSVYRPLTRRKDELEVQSDTEHIPK